MMNASTLYNDLYNLCNTTDAFYFVDHVVNGRNYRVFTYRLASFMDFQHKNALECRGHTFEMTSNGPILVSIPMNKFFNYDEHIGWGQNVDLSGDIMIVDKLDGSLISTVHYADNLLLKSKTSFTSKQALDSLEWINQPSNEQFCKNIRYLMQCGYTVNFEWTSPDNMIVIGYDEPRLTVLNARHLNDGSYLNYKELQSAVGAENVASVYDIPTDPYSFMEDVRSMTGIEGVIVYTQSGLIVKHKTDAYVHTHRFKDSVSSDRKLFELCVSDGSDDARSLFVHDKIVTERINNMEQFVSKIYNNIHKTVYSFYDENKNLERKDYAVKGQKELDKMMFNICMSLYLGKDVDIKESMIKNYKQFGISDVEETKED